MGITASPHMTDCYAARNYQKFPYVLIWINHKTHCPEKSEVQNSTAELVLCT